MSYISLPSYLRLMRLHRPTGIWLLLWPCWWGIALASQGMPSLKLLLLFALGSIVMRGAGCIINDLFDRKLDAQVERTKHRPLASGELTAQQALLFLGLLLSIGLLILLQLNHLTVLLGLAAIIPVVLYPLMKRITYWPQAFLGITFNWGALMGFAAVTGKLELPAILLYIGSICWTLGYDTIYAHQDKRDDVIAGIKSTALRFGTNSRKWIGGFYIAALIFFALAGAFAKLGWVFWPVLILAANHCYWQVRHIDFDDPRDCLATFQSNVYLGGIVFVAVLWGSV